MTFVLAAVNRVFDLLFVPFRSLDPLWALVAFAVLTAALVLVAFRATSDQRAIRTAKDRMQAHLLEIHLFRDQFGVVLRAYGGMLRGMGSYLRHSFKPLLVLFVPLALLFVQFDLRWARRPLEPGRPFLVKAKFSREISAGHVLLRLPAGLRQTAPPLVLASEKEVDWRVAAEQPGNFTVKVALDQQEYEKDVVVSGPAAHLSPVRVRVGWTRQFVNPGEAPLPAAGPLDAIEVGYPRRTFDLRLFESEWLVPFLILLLVATLALKGVLRTEI